MEKAAFQEYSALKVQQSFILRQCFLLQLHRASKLALKEEFTFLLLRYCISFAYFDIQCLSSRVFLNQFQLSFAFMQVLVKLDLFKFQVSTFPV